MTTRTSTRVVRLAPRRSTCPSCSAQDLWLELEGQVANLVEEDSAAIRELEPAGLCGVRSCECAPLAPELAFAMSVARRPAIDDDETPVPARAVLVDGASDELFTGASHRAAARWHSSARPARFDASCTSDRSHPRW